MIRVSGLPTGGSGEMVYCFNYDGFVLLKNTSKIQYYFLLKCTRHTLSRLFTKTTRCAAVSAGLRVPVARYTVTVADKSQTRRITTDISPQSRALREYHQISFNFGGKPS